MKSPLRLAIEGLLALMCVSASLPPLPPQPVAPKTQLVSPRHAASTDNINRPMAFAVIVPLVTNGMAYSVGITGFRDLNGQLLLMDYPTWVWIDRCNDLNAKPQVWTNFWSGSLPTNRVIKWNSVAPLTKPPSYRVTLSFQNNTN